MHTRPISLAKLRKVPQQCSWVDQRLVREALSFSKKLANHIGAIKLCIWHYNLTRAAA